MSFGANAGNPLAQILAGLHTLESSPGVSQFSCSSIYQTPPMGPEQPDYLNGVARFRYSNSALSLLDLFQSIERSQGRDRDNEIHWGPRPLDFDILLFSELQHNCERLTLPHPGMNERPFVLIPFSELDPELILPNGCSVRTTAQMFDASSIQCLYTAQGLPYDSYNRNPQ